MNKFYEVDSESVGINYKLYGEYKTLLFDKTDLKLIQEYQLRICTKGYAQCRKKVDKGKWLMVHNVLMNPPEGFEVDHINGNRVDNRRSKLRICTHPQNCKNFRPKNKCPNVYISNSSYIVQFKINGKNKHIGSRKNYDDAIKLRNQEIKKYYGEYANIYENNAKP